MAQLEASMSGVVLGGVAEVMGSNLARGKYLQHYKSLSVCIIPLYIIKLTKNVKWSCEWLDKASESLCLPDAISG